MLNSMDENKNVFTNKALVPPQDVEKQTEFTQEEKDAKDVEKGKNNVFLAFGWGKFRPKCLQFLNCPIWFFIVISTYALCQGVVIIGLSNLMLPTIERRYGLTSKELGLIAAANDITALLLVVFLSYYGDYANKINLIGIGAVFVGIGAFVFALPHFMIGRYEPDDKRTKSQCIITNVTIMNDFLNCEGDSGKWYHMATFIVAQLIMGGGVAPTHSLLPAYLDENVDPKSIPIYLGFFYFFVFVGPGVGYFIGGKLLSIYVDIKQPDGYQLTPQDPRWIGAWWIGFPIFGTLTFLSSILLFGFPRQLPGAKEHREKHIRHGHIKAADGMAIPKLRNFLPGLKNLLTNWTYLFNSLALTLSLLYVASVNAFLAKIFQLKFGLDPQRTGYVIAVISIAGILFGSLFGSLAVRMFSLKEACRKAAFLCFSTNLVTICGPLIFLIPGCMNSNLAGVSASYHTQRVVNGQISTTPQVFNFPLKSHCNTNCGCSLKSFSPVCGSDSRTYFDACHAGCTVRLPNTTFANCSCIPGMRTNSLNGTAQPGYCDRKCKNIIVFAVLTAILGTIQFTGLTPGRIVTLRSVPDNRRAFALGIQYVSIKTLGLLPGPIIFGHLVDLSCRLWQDYCGKKGRCFDYNIEELSQTIAIFGIVVSIVKTLSYFLSWYLYKPESNKTDISAEVIQNPGAEDETHSEITQL